MEEPVEYLVSRRSRRSTAGNRMEAALAEMALDDANKDLDDDNDFVNDKDEEDVFESDFESTDDEAQVEGAESGETGVLEEEKRARRTARSRAEKATAAAHEKNKATFNPQAVTAKPKAKPKRHVMLLKEAVNVETGEIIEVVQTPVTKKRKSERVHTVRNTSATVTRMKESEERKAAIPKKPKTETRNYTQMELIAHALDNEEGNIVEHRDYLKLEEEKRKRARVIRTAIEGPLIRWISKKEEIKVAVEPPLPTAPSNTVPIIYGTYGSSVSFASTSYGGSSQAPSMQSIIPTDTRITSPAPAIIPQPFQAWPPPPTPTHMTPDIDPQLQLLPPPPQINILPPQPNVPPPQPNVPPPQPSAPPPQPNVPPPQSNVPPPQPIPAATPKLSRMENVAKNYVVHEVAQYDGAPKPSWKDTMGAMFGNHVRWDELKVYVGKGRPLSRPKQICPITGKQARYLDPRTGVPFADIYAYNVLTRILRHEYIWSPELGSYIGQDQSQDQPMNVEDRSQENS